MTSGGLWHRRCEWPGGIGAVITRKSTSDSEPKITKTANARQTAAANGKQDFCDRLMLSAPS